MVSWWSNLGPQTYKVVAHEVNLDGTLAVNQDAPVTGRAPVSSETALGASASSEQVPTPARAPGAGPEVKSYVIRLACVNDCSAIAKLELASSQFERRLTPINYTFDELRTQFERRLTPINYTFDELRTLWRKRINSGEFYVLVAEGQVAGGDKAALVGQSASQAAALAPLRSQMLGFVGLKAPLGQEGFIQAIYIAPPFYHQGLGGSLLKAAEKILRQRGCGRVTLYVEPFNRMGQCFYRKAGFYATKQKYRHLDILVKEL